MNLKKQEKRVKLQKKNNYLMIHLINKTAGETPLEAIERFRSSDASLSNVPLTYAGRLDPLAEGVLLVLSGDDCKQKDKYLGLDKEYEVEMLLGIQTDSHDLLGMPEGIMQEAGLKDLQIKDINFNQYKGKFLQNYPAFSSKTVGGTQLHELARKGVLPEEMPKKEVEIYSIEKIGEREVTGEEVLNKAIWATKTVRGNFRQEEIAKKWTESLSDYKKIIFPIIKLKIKCSSGTYMRSLADKMGKELKCGSIAYSIRRTEIFL